MHIPYDVESLRFGGNWRKCVGMTQREKENELLLGRIWEALGASGLTENQLATKLKTSASTVGGWFPKRNGIRVAGGKVPGGVHLAQLPRILSVSGHWLLTGDEPRKPIAPGEAEWRLQKIKGALEAPYRPKSRASAVAKAAADALTEEDRDDVSPGRSG